jgi:predicted transcriptional regulator
MKNATLPPLRVEPALRRAAERLLREGETLSAFVEDAVRSSVAQRQSQEEFVARGLASAAAARESGRYLSSEEVVAKLEKRLAVARAAKGRGGPRRRT